MEHDQKLTTPQESHNVETAGSIRGQETAGIQQSMTKS